jgi:hypothetical protein
MALYARPYMKRGLTYLEAMDYVGVKRRTFDVQWRPHLVAISQGTSLIFDREDLDRLFDQFKQNTRCLAPASPVVGTCQATVPETYVPQSMESIPAAVSSLADRRPTSRKGVERWVVKTASTKTQRAGGESTNSTAVNAFKAVSDRIRRPKLG